MEIGELQNFLPLGGASVLLVYLLRLISYERSRWIKERATLIHECRDETEALRNEIARHRNDFDLYIARLVAEGERRDESNRIYIGQLKASLAELRVDYVQMKDRYLALMKEREQ